MKTIKVVITDLDNTLFDWVKIWHRPFEAMLNELVSKSGVEKDTLLDEIKAVFTEHGTSEYAFVIQELPSLIEKHPEEDLAKVYASAVDAYRKARHEVLELYPDVEETLQTLKDRGCLIVGYTESQGFYSNYRMKTLGLDRILDFLYSPPDHDLPDGLTREKVRRYTSEHYRLRRTIHRCTPEGELKPNPDILRQIIEEVGARPDEVIYVGDSLMKDVAMAQQASVISLWAKYGIAQDRPEYELLRRITHWSAEDVAKEKKLTPDQITPSHVAERSFGELLASFDFKPFMNQSPDHVNRVVEAWKTSVDVQKHFNDLEMKVRNFALTLATALVAASAFALKEKVCVELFGCTTSLAAVILLAAAPVWLAFYFMDVGWYHRLLIGAVKHGMWIERRAESILPELSLAGAISDASPLKICRCLTLRSSCKIHCFYLGGFLMLVLAALVALFGIRTDASKGSDQDTKKQTEKVRTTTGKMDAQNEEDHQEEPTTNESGEPNLEPPGKSVGRRKTPLPFGFTTGLKSRMPLVRLPLMKSTNRPFVGIV